MLDDKQKHKLHEVVAELVDEQRTVGVVPRGAGVVYLIFAMTLYLLPPRAQHN